MIYNRNKYSFFSFLTLFIVSLAIFLHIRESSITATESEGSHPPPEEILIDTRYVPLNSDDNEQYAKQFQPVKVENPAREIPVLMYHHLLKDKENNYKHNPVILSAEKFEEQMSFLRSNDYYTASLQELEQFIYGKLDLPKKTVVLTFDDGYKSNLEYAYPVLKKLNFKASIFIITEKLDSPPEKFTPSHLVYLSSSELPQLRDIFTLDSHTNGLHHLKNGKGLIQELPDKEVLADLRLSRSILKTDYLAYPIGRFDRHVMQLVKEAGYKMAFTTDEGKVKREDNPYALKRVFVDGRFSLDKFKLLVQPE